MAIRKRTSASGKPLYSITVYTDTDENGKRNREYASASTLAEARAIEAELKARYSPRESTRDAITLNRYIDSHYWPMALKRLSASTLDTYDQEIRIRIKPALGKMRLRDIDRAAIQGLMVDNTRTSGTARTAIGVLKTILNEAISDGYITKNHACAKFALPSTVSRPRDNGLVLSTFAEIDALLDIVDEHGSVCVQRIAYTGLLLGLRPEERYALDWSCFDLNARTVTISEARISASAKHGGVQNKATKTKNSARTIPMPPRFYDFVMSTPAIRHGAFILAADGGRISPSTAQHRWRRFLQLHPECPQVTIENMRHSFATAYLSAGGRIEVLSRLLGHSTINTTINRYYRPDVEVLRKDMTSTLATESRPKEHFRRSKRHRPEFDSPRLHHRR